MDFEEIHPVDSIQDIENIELLRAIHKVVHTLSSEIYSLDLGVISQNEITSNQQVDQQFSFL